MARTLSPERLRKKEVAIFGEQEVARMGRRVPKLAGGLFARGRQVAKHWGLGMRVQSPVSKWVQDKNRYLWFIREIDNPVPGAARAFSFDTMEEAYNFYFVCTQKWVTRSRRGTLRGGGKSVGYHRPSDSQWGG